MAAMDKNEKTTLIVPGSAKRWALGCVNPTSWLPWPRGGVFTQPRAHLIANFVNCRGRVSCQMLPVDCGKRDYGVQNRVKNCSSDLRLNFTFHYLTERERGETAAAGKMQGNAE